MKRPKLFLSLLLFWGKFVQADQPAAYKLSVTLSPESRSIHVEGLVTVKLDDKQRDRLTFEIHEAFDITKLEINGTPAKHSFEKSAPSRLTPTARKVTTELPDNISDTQVDVSFSYEGKLRELPNFGAPGSDGPFLDDAITSERIELSYYSSWYPSFGFGSRFDADLEVTLPRDWRVACIGKELALSETKVRCVGQELDDLVIVASPEFEVETVDTSSGQVLIYHTRLPEKFVSREVEETEKTLRFFRNKVGPSRLKNSIVKHVYSPRELGQGGYARAGMTVTSEGRVLTLLASDPHASLLRGMAHEMGHFWWNFGAEQGDWMNEAFAEYFSLLAVREIQGKESFDTALAQRKKAVAELPVDAPAISLVPASNDDHGYTIRYFKGAMMLDHFRLLMGDDSFFRSCRDFFSQYKNDRVETTEFRTFWTEALGSDRKWLGSWLDSKGAQPKTR